MTCQARQYSDEMHCPRCRLRWDTNDPEPPVCGMTVATRSADESLERSNRYIRTLRKSPPLAPERLPFASGLPFVDNQHRK